MAATASLLIRLANEPSSRVVANATAGRAALAATIQPLWETARGRYARAARTAARHVGLVMENNPRADPDVLLARPDVVQAILDPFQAAFDRHEADLRSAWARGVREGSRQARADMAALGMEIPAGRVGVDRAILNEALARHQANRDAHMQRVRERILAVADFGIETLESGAEIERHRLTRERVARAITIVANDEANRARAGISTVAGEAYSEAQRALYGTAAADGGYVVKLMWVTHFRPGTCGTCAALHGKVVTLGSEFDHFAHFGSGQPPAVFGNLQGPPRHPNCGCRIVPFIDSDTQEQARALDPDTPLRRTDAEGPTPASLEQFARGWWGSVVAKVKRLFRKG